MMEKRGPYSVLSSREVYRNPWIAVREDKVLRPSGKDGVFGIVEMVAGSTVLAIDRHGFAYVTKEYKYGIDGMSIELVSGGIAPGEQPIDCAKRELKEETGISANEWEYMEMINPFTSVISSPNHLFIARELNFGKPLNDIDEQVGVQRISFVELVDMAVKGIITHGASCTLILKAAVLMQNGKKMHHSG